MESCDPFREQNLILSISTMKQYLLPFALLTGLSLSAQKKAIQFEEYTLDNGLHVILHEDHTTPIVAVTVLYHVGSKNEVAGRTGFAHFFEHLLFEGSENIGRGEYMKIIAKTGGALNANTTQDRTFYYEVLPSNQLELGLWMESERMLHAKINVEGVETQREVVKEEKRQRIDNQPYMSFQAKIFDHAFPGTPYEWVPIGSMDDLNAAQLSEFIDFYKKFYVPNNATLSIAGDIDPKQAKKWIEMYFGGIPKGAPVVQPELSIPPVNPGENREVVYDNIQLPGIFMGYRTPGQTENDAYAVSMLAQVLAQGASSRLYKRLVDEEQSAVTVVAFPYQLEKAGMLISLALASQGHSIEELEKSILEEVEKLKSEPIGEREFQKLQNQIENGFVSSNSSMAGIAESLADYHTYYGDANLINTEIDRYRKITPADLQRVAQKYFVDANKVVLEYRPNSEKPAEL